MQKKIKSSLYSKFINNLCQKYTEKDFSVFDCGCGDGFHTSIIKKYSNNVIGGDFDNRTKVEYVINFRKIGINDYGKKNEFDIITSFDVIEHVEDDVLFIQELLKITKPGGIIIIGTPNINRLSNKIHALLFRKIAYPRRLGYHYASGGEIIHLREYSHNDLKILAKKFSKIEIIKIYSSFVGLYLPIIGPLGLRSLDVKFLKKYCQHLFLVLRKK